MIVPGNVYAGLDAVATKIINENRRMPAKLLYRLAPVIVALAPVEAGDVHRATTRRRGRCDDRRAGTWS